MTHPLLPEPTMFEDVPQPCMGDIVWRGGGPSPLPGEGRPGPRFGEVPDLVEVKDGKLRFTDAGWAEMRLSVERDRLARPHHPLSVDAWDDKFFNEYLDENGMRSKYRAHVAMKRKLHRKVNYFHVRYPGLAH